MNQTYDSNELIDALDFRIKSIEKAKKKVENSISGDKKNNRKQYYFEVAYFVHTICENYNLNILFEELLSYKSQLKQRKDYSIALSSINKSIKSIAIQILNHKCFGQFEKEIKGDWINPFEKIPLLKTRILLERLKDLDKNKLTIPFSDIYSIYVSKNGLDGLLDRFARVCGNIPEEIISELEIFGDNLRILFFQEQFHSDYLGVDSALKLQMIYRNLHPLYKPIEINEAVFNSIIKSGEDTIEANSLLTYCENLRNYLKQRLNTKFSIKVSIQRFKHYMEVYYKGEISKSFESVFQKEFELFMFNNGYFALSEGQVGSARFDNIIFNENNAFLCEHKQIGFGKTKESKKKRIKKFQSSKIQAKIYHERLRFLPELSYDIYIIIFSKFRLRFKDSISEIQRDGLNFKFELICLEKTTPSKINIEEEIDIEKIIQ